MTASVAEELPKTLSALLGTAVQVERAELLAGGASKEAWAVAGRMGDAHLELIIRRAAGGAIYTDALSLEHEHRVLEEAYRAKVCVPQPHGYIPELAGKPAFAMQRLEGEGIGRRIVTRPELEAVRRRLPGLMAEELAKIHGIAPERLPFLPGSGQESPSQYQLRLMYGQLDALEEPHPAIELGLRYLREHAPERQERVVCHGDFRLGNLLVSTEGLVGVLDWEFAHLGDPAEDLAWPLVRAWRFGADQLRLGGIASEDEYLARYNALTGRDITPATLAYWELFGNVRWAIGALTQARRHLRGEERSVELATLGRLAAEVEHEVLRLLEVHHAG